MYKTLSKQIKKHQEEIELALALLSAMSAVPSVMEDKELSKAHDELTKLSEQITAVLELLKED